MPRKRKGMNKHQKAMFKVGDHRVRRDDQARLLALSFSADPEERLEAADNLCPCHVRKPMPEIQQAIFRMMEDPDLRVRRAAWHTIEDGGVPDDPELDKIYERAIARGEDDKMITAFMREFVEPRVKERQLVEFTRAQHAIFNQRGKCDFCGESNMLVKREYGTAIPTHDGTGRLALVCESCA